MPTTRHCNHFFTTRDLRPLFCIFLGEFSRRRWGGDVSTPNCMVVLFCFILFYIFDVHTQEMKIKRPHLRLRHFFAGDDYLEPTNHNADSLWPFPRGEPKEPTARPTSCTPFLGFCCAFGQPLFLWLSLEKRDKQIPCCNSGTLQFDALWCLGRPSHLWGLL